MEKTLKYTLARNLAIGALGLATSFNMLIYNVGTSMNLSEASKVKNPPSSQVKEMYIELDKMQNIQNAAIGIGGASGLYLIFGLGIPLMGYAIKKKSLEKATI